MVNVNTLLFVGIAVFAILSVAPVAVPLLENLMTSTRFLPRPY